MNDLPTPPKEFASREKPKFLRCPFLVSRSFFFYCKSCLESFRTIITKKFVLDFPHVGVKTSPLSQLSHARSTNIWRCFVYDELKRKDMSSWTLNPLWLFTRFLSLFFRIVEKHNRQSDMFWSMENPAKCRSHTLSRAFPDDSQSELFLTVAIVKQPIKALSMNSWKTAGYWNMISDAVSQTSLFQGWKEIGDVCTQASGLNDFIHRLKY